MQQQLFEIQKRPEAWGLILPLLDHSDPNVQFFGAHTAQVKIVRDWYVTESTQEKLSFTHLNLQWSFLGILSLKTMLYN